MITEKTKQDLLTRSRRRCECERADCRHHRPNARCPRGLRGAEWYVVQREAGAGEKLWNLFAVCRECYRTTQK